MKKSDKRFPIAAQLKEEGRQVLPIAFQFSNPEASIELAQEGEGEEKVRRFKMLAYSGKIFRHVLWDNMAIDLKSLEIPQKMPILREHFTDRIVGVSEKISKENGVNIEGKFSDVTADGQEVDALAAEGYPWQASVRIEGGTIEFVPSGEEVEVNGQKLKGPGTVFKNATLREASFATLGADPRTKAGKFTMADTGSRQDVIETFCYPGKKGSDEMPDDNKHQGQAAAPPAQGATDTTVTASQNPPPQNPPATDQAFNARVNAEVETRLNARKDRERKIREAAFSGQEELAQKLIDGESSVEDCVLALVADRKKVSDARMTALTHDPAAGIEGGASTSATGGDKFTEASLIVGRTVNEQAARAMFAANPQLQDEFWIVEDYLAWLQMKAEGHVNILSKTLQ